MVRRAGRVPVRRPGRVPVRRDGRLPGSGVPAASPVPHDGGVPVGDTGDMASSQVTPQRSAATPAKRKRGRETAADMIRSLGLVLVLVGVVWYLAQPPRSDEKQLRVVDPTSDLTALQVSAPGIPVPGGLPAGWRPTSSTPTPGSLRIGYVTPQDQYAEYAASTTASPDFVADLSGRGTPVGTFQVGNVPWQQLRDAAGHDTLVRVVADRTVVVGGVRETSTLDELRTLAAAVR